MPTSVIVAMATSPPAVPGRVRLPGLDPNATYEVARLGPEPAYGSLRAGWLQDDVPVPVSGAVLGAVGCALPTLLPESALVLGLRRISVIGSTEGHTSVPIRSGQRGAVDRHDPYG